MTTDQHASAICRVAVVGAGSMAREHLRAFADVPGVVLAGIQSRSRGRAEQLGREFGIAQVCDSVEELWDRTRAELVVVTVPVLAMNRVSRDCFRAPWTVLLEKPAGYNVTDASEIASARQSSSKSVFVGLNRRLYGSTIAVNDDLSLDTGRRYIHVQDQQDFKAARAAGHPEEVVRNWMYANSIHLVDYLRVFGRGEVRTVRTVFGWNHAKPGIVVAEIEFESGDIGIYEGIWDGPGPWAVAVTTGERRWEMRPLETAAVQRRGERTVRRIEDDPWDHKFKPGFRRQAASAVRAALGGDVTNLATIDDALGTMRLIERIFS